MVLKITNLLTDNLPKFKRIFLHFISKRVENKLKKNKLMSMTK